MDLKSTLGNTYYKILKISYYHSWEYCLFFLIDDFKKDNILYILICNYVFLIASNLA